MKLFTNTTWTETLKGQYLTRRRAQGTATERMLFWEDQHDLAVQLAEAQPALTFEMARTLVEATCSGLPVTLIWRNRLDGERMQTTTATVIITELGQPGTHIEAHPGMVRVRYWGFGHSIYLNEITAVEVPKTDYTFEDGQ